MVSETFFIGAFYAHISLFIVFGIIGIIANIVSDYRNKISYLASSISLISFLSLILIRINLISHPIFTGNINAIISLFIASLATTIVSQYSFDREMEANLKGKQYYIGTVLKAFAVSFAVIWVLFKLSLFPDSWLPLYTPSIDSALGYALLLYILGAGFEAMELRGPSGILSGFFKGLAMASILALIFSYFAQWVGMVENWQMYHDAIFKLTLASIVVFSLLYITLPQKDELFRLSESESKKIRTRVLFRDININLHDKMSLEVKKESLFIPFSLEGYLGGYIQGFVEYRVDTELKRIRGKADEVLILSKEKIFDPLLESSESISASDLIFRDINTSELRDRINILLSELKKNRLKPSSIKLPFVKIVEGEDFDYVKVGPITIYDFAEGGSYVKIGPLKIVEGDISNMLKSAYIVVRDLDRGLVKAAISGENLTLNVSGEKIRIGRDYEEYQTDNKKIRISGNKVIVRINDTKIILEGEEKAIIKKPNKKIIADKISGTIIVSGESGKKVVRDRNQAITTIKRIKESISKILKETLKEPEIEEVRGLISYLDDLLKRR